MSDTIRKDSRFYMDDGNMMGLQADYLRGLKAGKTDITFPDKPDMAEGE